MLFGQNVALTDDHNVVLGQPEGTLKPILLLPFFFFYTINPGQY